MATTIDSLEIQITSNADKAARALERLAKNCSNVSVALKQVNSSGLSQMSNSMYHLRNAMNAIKSVDTRTYSTLAKNLNKIAQTSNNLNQSAIALQRMNTQISKMSGIGSNVANISQLASALSKLGYKSVQSAAVNLPILTTALRNLVTTLNSSPQAIRNTTQLAYAISSMANQMRRIPATSNSANTSLKQTNTTVEKSSKSWSGLASAIGKFYATYFLVIRGVRSLWNSVKSSMDYLETLNYFNAAMEQVASRASQNWKEMGYENAEAYYNSFSERTREITSQLTGYNVNNNGTLTQTSGLSLGLNPTQTLQYQAQFSQMASSMGVSSENALKLSEALTKIGADLASVKNMEFADVWNDLSSGLVGMSRTLDKYGTNIRNVNMQQKLTELGINANINSLSQADKALLRTIILLDSTQYAFGDLADTIQSPANQLRLFSMNMKMAGQLLGNIFMGVVSNTLPVLNGFAIALQRVLVYVGELLGVDMSDFASGSSGSNNSAISDILDDAENATEAVQELKAQIMGFDEINKLSDSNSGSGNNSNLTNSALQSAFDAQLAEYQKKWNNALKNMSNNANGIADRIEKALAPVKKLIGDFVIGDFFAVGEDVSTIVKDIEKFISKAIKSVDWKGVGKNIGKFLKGIDWKGIFLGLLDIINSAIKALIDTWASSFKTAPLETAIVTLLAAMKFTGLGKKLTGALATQLGIGLKGAASSSTLTSAGTTIGNSIAAAIVSAIVGYNIGNKIYESVTGKDADPISKIFDYSLEEINENLPQSLEDTKDIIYKFFLDISNEWDKTSIGKFYNSTVGQTLIGGKPEGDKTDTLVDWFGSGEGGDVVGSTIGAVTGTKPSGDKTPTLIEWFGDKLNTLMGIKPESDNTESAWDVFFYWLTHNEAPEGGWKDYNKPDNSGHKFTFDVEANTQPAEKNLKDLKNKVNNTKGTVKVDANTNSAKTTVNSFKKTVTNTKFTSKLEASKTNAENTLQKFKKTYGATNYFQFKSSVTNPALDKIQKNLDNFAKKNKKIDIKLDFNLSAFTTDAKGNKVNYTGSALFNSLDKLIVPAHAAGGVVEDGLFYANHNELIGNFANGKTAVANNDQIIGGIAMGMSEATVETNSLLRELIVAVKNGKDIIVSGKSLLSATQNEAKKQENLTGRVSYS